MATDSEIVQAARKLENARKAYRESVETLRDLQSKAARAEEQSHFIAVELRKAETAFHQILDSGIEQPAQKRGMEFI